MKKYISFIFLFYISIALTAQVVINGLNNLPSNADIAFQIDARGNTTVLNGNLNNVDDDVVILNSGNVGVGTSSPIRKLTIAPGKIMRIVDSQEQNGRLLMSDARGSGGWTPSDDWELAYGSIDNQQVRYHSENSNVWFDITENTLNLDAGTWVIFARYTGRLAGVATTEPLDERVSWIGIFDRAISNNTVPLTSLCFKAEYSAGRFTVAYLVYSVTLTQATEFRIGASAHLPRSSTFPTIFAETLSNMGGSYFYAIRLSAS